MDSQSSLRNVAGMAALVHALARAGGRGARPVGAPRRAHGVELPRRARRARRDVWYDGALRPVPEVARAAVELARPYARELGSDAALDEIERMLVDGNGAIRQRAAFARGGMPAVLAGLVEETARPPRTSASHAAERARR